MKTYRYKLEPYKGGQSRYTCPKCKTPRKFVRYIDTITGKHLDKTVGRCERSENCGYHYTPSEYFHDTQTLETPRTAIFTNKHFNPGKLPDMIREKSHQSPGSIPVNLLENLFHGQHPEQTNLLKHLVIMLHISPTRLHDLIRDYRLMAASHGRIIFPQVDIDGNYRTAKVMAYHPHSGRRIKDQPGSFNWIHAILIRQKKLPAEFNLQQCLFGEHLLFEYPGKPIGLVESEKTALVCAVTYPKLLWLATGGKYNFNRDRLRPLTGRIVNVIPDAGTYQYWNIRAKEIRRAVKCQLYISDCIERVASLDEIEKGIDIADLILENRKPEFF